ncbi:MAG: SDR family oxidoreductase [Acidimicrobiia bacterium]
MTTALVTGASAGIGREFARQLAVRGHDVVLVARDAKRLAELAADLERAHGIDAEVLAADLGSPDGLATVEARIADVDRVDIVVNNAAFGTFGRFAELAVEQEEAEIRLNVLALVRLTHAALSVMEPRGVGAVVNVSSLAAYQPSPNSATYSATKAFVNSFTQAVHEEARTRGVNVLLVCPGYTHTEFHDRAGLGPPGVPEFVWQAPETVVTAALRDLDRGRAVSIPGALNRTMAALSSITPAGITRRAAGMVVKRNQD